MKKTLRKKQRHLLVETNSKADEKSLLELIQNQYLKFFGVFGLSEADIKLQTSGDKLVFTCNYTEKDKLIFVLSTINQANGKKIYFQTKKVSGTIRALTN